MLPDSDIQVISNSTILIFLSLGSVSVIIYLGSFTSYMIKVESLMARDAHRQVVIRVGAIGDASTVQLFPWVQVIVGPVFGLASAVVTGVRRDGPSNASDSRMRSGVPNSVTAPGSIGLADPGRSNVFRAAVLFDPSVVRLAVPLFSAADALAPWNLAGCLGLVPDLGRADVSGSAEPEIVGVAEFCPR